MLVTVLHRDCIHAKTASPFSSFLPGRTVVMGFPMKMHPAFSICRDLSYWDSCSFFNKGALPNQSLKSFAFLHDPLSEGPQNNRGIFFRISLMHQKEGTGSGLESSRKNGPSCTFPSATEVNHSSFTAPFRRELPRIIIAGLEYSYPFISCPWKLFSSIKMIGIVRASSISSVQEGMFRFAWFS